MLAASLHAPHARTGGRTPMKVLACVFARDERSLAGSNGPENSGGPSRTRTCDLLVRSRGPEDVPNATDSDEDPPAE